MDIRVPQLGESVVEATIARWLKGEGDRVALGDALVELETEKVNVEVPAEAVGTLRQITHREGDTVQVGEVIGVLETTTDAASTAATPAAAPASSAPAAAAASAAASTPATKEASASAAVPASAEAQAHYAVSPVARRMAEEHGLDPAAIPGRGPGGRVMKDDVREVIEKPPPALPAVAIPAALTAPASPHAVTSAVAAGRREERRRLSRRRLTIARRLVEAQHAAAMLTTFNEIDMSAVMELRKRRRDSFKERHGVSLGFMSFFTKAAIGALKASPQINSELQGDELIVKHYYDIGIAVSTEEGLVVPVVRDAGNMTFAQIEREIGALAVKARERRLTLEELSGGTFTITNGGVFGSLLSTPILNAPQVAILGMHKIEERPMALNGQVVIRPMMYVALTYDHRVVDGREAVSFLVRVKELVEDPESLLLEG